MTKKIIQKICGLAVSSAMVLSSIAGPVAEAWAGETAALAGAGSEESIQPEEVPSVFRITLPWTEHLIVEPEKEHIYIPDPDIRPEEEMKDIPNLEKLVATIRSREISACLVLQAKSQLKAIYKDNADTIIGNMDSQVFLGGSEPTTLKDLAEALGKETIDTFNTSDTRGNSPSYGTNYQKLGKELMSRDEIAVLDGSKCVLQLRGVRPFLSDKYDLTQHPNYKYTADFDKRYTFDIEKFLNHRMKLKASEEYEVVEVDEAAEETA